MKQIKFYGIGGQGVVTAAKILSIIVSLHEDEYAITVPAYGHERRGAPVYTDIIIDNEAIVLNCFVYEPDMVVVLDETIWEKGVQVGSGIHEETDLVLNTTSEETARFYKEKYGFRSVYWVDATGIAVEKIGRGIPNGAILGALAEAGIANISSVESGIKEFFGSKGGESNAAAARASYEAVKKI